jgi:hypothetical protein
VSPVNLEPAEIMRALYGDGVTSLKGAFDTAFADDLREDIEILFEEARSVEGGMLPRGPQRYYVEVQPERIRGFAQIASHPWFVAVCTAVLGRDYRIIEIGFDIPFPGAADQPWHRDFTVPDATSVGRRLNSLAFNLTAVDTHPDMGPFEYAPGTHWDEFDGCERGMFPPSDLWPRYTERARSSLPRRGDMSVRSALMIHRGTANRSSTPRPVLVVGVDAPDATNSAHHDLQATPQYLEQLPAVVRDHLECRIVDRLTPVIQHHVIDGLLSPAY